MHNNIRTIIEAISNHYSDDFFNAITLALAHAITADYTYIAELDTENSLCKTIAIANKNKIIANVEYSFKYTPCANVIDNTIGYYPQQVCTHFPKDQRLIELKISAYFGIPLQDSKQNIIGIIVALYKEPLLDNQQVMTLFQLFSGRIIAELAHRNDEMALEETVLSRTLALSASVEKLQQVQQQLVESEKMAALGGLVAGITHEVNTPLGIAITTHSIIADEHEQLNIKIADKHLSMKDMEHYCNTVDNALSMQKDNLIRAKKLIEYFKKNCC